MTFGLTPVTGYPPATADDFPNFIQFQQDGENLGGPDADTVNFTGDGVSATRGEGENAGVVTVTVAGGGQAEVMVVSLQVFVDELSSSASGMVVDWTSSPTVASTDAEWDDSENGVVFATAGVYRVMTKLQLASGMFNAGGYTVDMSTVLDGSASTYGSPTSIQKVAIASGSGNVFYVNDVIYVNAQENDTLQIRPVLQWYDSISVAGGDFSLIVEAQRIGPYNEES